MSCVGMIRVVFEKRLLTEADAASVRAWDKNKTLSEIEILGHETFDSGFCTKQGPARVAREMSCELGIEEQVRDAAAAFSPGFYELVGQFHYEYNPGHDTPNGPAEADAWWWLENPGIQELTEEQASWFGDWA